MNIVSFGCGYDTTFFWLNELSDQRAGFSVSDLRANLCFTEVDYDKVVNQKIEIINRNPQKLRTHINLESDQDGNPSSLSEYEINTSNYKLFAHNICDTQGMSEVLKNKFNVKGDIPTLVLTECLLIYLRPEHAQGVLKWIGSYFSGSPFVGVANYEMINPHDTFGRKMVDNLVDRGCELLGIHACDSLAS